MDEGRFQVAVGAIILNRSSQKILLIHRSASQYVGNIWEFPVGRSKQFETLLGSLLREVKEEVGITDLKVGRPISVFEFMHGKNAADNEVRGIVFEAQTDQEKIVLSEEHDAYKWLSLDEALALVSIPGIKRDLMAYRDLRATLS